MSFWDEKKAKKLFQKNFHFAFIEKPRAQRRLLHERPFHDALNIVKIPKAFKIYARSYKIEKIFSIKKVLWFN